MSRSAPADGYEFSNKKVYRRQVWKTIRDALKKAHTPLGTAHALLMPSTEGDEIKVALDAGFREYHLHVVDKNPAVVATLKRRFPKIHTYGVTASRAIERIGRQGIRLHCLNLDFCNFISKSLSCELGIIAEIGNGFSIGFATKADGDLWSIPPTENTGHGVFSDVCVVVVNLMRARESRHTITSWGRIPFTDDLLESDERNLRSEINSYGGPTNGEDLLEDKLSKALRTMQPRDRQRILIVLALLRSEHPERDQHIKPAIRLLRTESYQSISGQPFMWSAWQLFSRRETCRRLNNLNTIRQQKGLPPYPVEIWRGTSKRDI